MKNTPFLMSIVLVLAALLVSSCGSRDQEWQEADASESTNSARRVVLFAATEIGPLAETDADATTRIPRDLTKYVQGLVDFADALYSENIPASADPAWEAGPVSTMSGANVAVVTIVDELLEERAVTPPYSRYRATVTLRAFNVRGEEFYRKTATGSALNESSPKLSTPGAQPPSKAVFEAARKCVVGLSKYLQQQSDIRATSTDIDPLADLPLIDVTIDSIPANADILVDGVFRGTTPSVVPLPDTEMEVQIRRQGHQTWSMRFRPEVNMTIKPALEALAE